MQSTDSPLQEGMNGKHIGRGLCMAALLQADSQAAEGCLCNLQDSFKIITIMMMLMFSSS